ncbi:MAG: gamma carbonic anhydrase family protein [Gammaproteobacteria bacterium]|nr:gamma carbonic anhydrase family protein [Gammaproteobacteria bacterium]
MTLYALGDRRPVNDGDFYVAPGASVIGDVELGPDCSVWFGAVVRGDVEAITLGRGVNIQDGSVLHTDPGAPMMLEDYVTVGHMVMLHGCRIGRYSLVGIGSVVLNHAVIGENCIIGANSLITERKAFPDGKLILGAPAKVVRDLTADEIAALPTYSQRYMDRARLYREQLSAV